MGEGPPVGAPAGLCISAGSCLPVASAPAGRGLDASPGPCPTASRMCSAFPMLERVMMNSSNFGTLRWSEKFVMSGMTLCERQGSWACPAQLHMFAGDTICLRHVSGTYPASDSCSHLLWNSVGLLHL